jgi:hypothetical protein
LCNSIGNGISSSPQSLGVGRIKVVWAMDDVNARQRRNGRRVFIFRFVSVITIKKVIY